MAEVDQLSTQMLSLPLLKSPTLKLMQTPRFVTWNGVRSVLNIDGRLLLASAYGAGEDATKLEIISKMSSGGDRYGNND